MSGYTYDAGALIAAENNRPALWHLHREALARGDVCTVPTVVVAQVWRHGARQANVGRLLKGCHVEPLDQERARRAGELVGLAGVGDFVDAAVVLGAVTRGDAVVTSDPGDIAALADAAGAPGLPIIGV